MEKIQRKTTKKELLETESVMRIKKKKVEILEDIVGKILGKNRTKRPKEGKSERNHEKRGAQSGDPTSR